MVKALGGREHLRAKKDKKQAGLKTKPDIRHHPSSCRRISSLSESFLSGHFVRDLGGSTDHHYGAHSLLPLVLKSSTMGF